jgi:DnaJ-class molecular chaperone
MIKWKILDELEAIGKKLPIICDPDVRNKVIGRNQEMIIETKDTIKYIKQMKELVEKTVMIKKCNHCRGQGRYFVEGMHPMDRGIWQDCIKCRGNGYIYVLNDQEHATEAGDS